MRNRLFVAVLLLLGGAGLVWSQFWKDMSDTERQTLGESYWLAGRQYEVVGKVEKGREYKELARRIYPELEPAAITDQEQPSAAELLASGRATADRRRGRRLGDPRAELVLPAFRGRAPRRGRRGRGGLPRRLRVHLRHSRGGGA